MSLSYVDREGISELNCTPTRDGVSFKCVNVDANDHLGRFESVQVIGPHIVNQERGSRATRYNCEHWLKDGFACKIGDTLVCECI